VGEPHLVGCAAELSACFGVDLAQHVAEDPRDGQALSAEEDLAVVDAAFGVGFEPCRVDPGVALGVTTDEDLAVGAEVDRRRQQRRTVEQQRPHPRIS
jgi:hypothetical protein